MQRRTRGSLRARNWRASGRRCLTDWAGAVADPAVVDDAWQAWRDEVAFAEKFVVGAPDLGLTGVMRSVDDGRVEEVSLREVLVHMIEEYARHCGHADLLRERIDGRVGQ